MESFNYINVAKETNNDVSVNHVVAAEEDGQNNPKTLTIKLIKL